MRLDIITSRAAADGGELAHLERGIRAGVLLRLRPGACVVRQAWLDADPRDRHRAAMDALLLTAGRPPVFAHESAALLHGIPVIGGWSEAPHLLDSELGSALGPPSRRSPRGAVVHRPRHRPGIVDLGGVLATDAVSTAIALAAGRPPAAGVAAFDHVLARGVERLEIEATMDAWAPFHGIGRARRAFALATGLAETALESLSLTGILRAGLPAPRQQVELVAVGRRYRVDFFWPDLGAVGEADGRAKYETRDDLIAEKDREDDLRSFGLRFARWSWDDALAVTPMLEKLARAGVVAPRIRPSSARNRRSRAESAE